MNSICTCTTNKTIAWYPLKQLNPPPEQLTYQLKFSHAKKKWLFTLHLPTDMKSSPPQTRTQSPTWWICIWLDLFNFHKHWPLSLHPDLHDHILQASNCVHSINNVQGLHAVYIKVNDRNRRWPSDGKRIFSSFTHRRVATTFTQSMMLA